MEIEESWNTIIKEWHEFVNESTTDEERSMGIKEYNKAIQVCEMELLRAINPKRKLILQALEKLQNKRKKGNSHAYKGNKNSHEH